jgi:1,4-dihydroxy-6-naphthoate synthase
MSTQVIRVGHSPDADDAYMFYALTHSKIPTENRQYVHVLEDIESLNRRALRGELEVTAISMHAYAYVADRYALLSCGCSMGDRFGPVVVSLQPWNIEDLRGKTIGIPGTMTTAFLLLRLLLRTSFAYELVPFDQILEAVRSGKVDAGLLIHEGQLTYRDWGLHKVVDLGEWWQDQTGLPVPLGGNAVRRDLGSIMRAISRDVRQSILYALEYSDEALAYAIQYARGLDLKRTREFVQRYVNEWTLDYGSVGREAVRRLFSEGVQAGILPGPVDVEFV